MNVIKYDDFCSIQYVSRETYDKFKIYYETLIFQFLNYGC